MVGFLPIEKPPNSEEGLHPWLRRMFPIWFGMQQGKLNNTSTLTLVASSTATTLADPRIGPDSIIFLSPRTSTASLASWYQNTTLKGSTVLTHASAATTDRTFGYAVFG